MHGPSFQGNGRQALNDLAAGYEEMLSCMCRRGAPH